MDDSVDKAIARADETIDWTRRVTEEAQAHARIALEAQLRIATALERIASALEKRNA